MYRIATNDNQYMYTITKHKRVGNYSVWVLSEYSNPDSNGDFMRARMIAKFGNTKHKENYKNARFTATCFVSMHNENSSM